MKDLSSQDFWIPIDPEPKKQRSKYDPLGGWLAQQSEGIVELSFEQVEEILDEPLPNSARSYARWWSNRRHPSSTNNQARAWLDVGWEVLVVDLPKSTVAFRKSSYGP